MPRKPIEETKRVSVGNVVRKLRDRLGVSQAGLADMLGSTISMITVSRWERGTMLPYPKTQAKLAEIAMQHNWWDIASALDVPVRFEEWVQAFRTNLPKGFDAWVKLTMCALNSVHFGGENDYAQMKQFAEKLCSRLAAMGKAGEMIAQPPNDGMKEVWQQFAEGGRDERQAE